MFNGRNKKRTLLNISFYLQEDDDDEDSGWMGTGFRSWESRWSSIARCYTSLYIGIVRFSSCEQRWEKQRTNPLSLILGPILRRKSEKAGKKTEVRDMLLLDVVPLSLGIEDIHGRMHTIISRNRTIRNTRLHSILYSPTHTRIKPAASIRVFEGEHQLTKYNVSWGIERVSLAGLSVGLAVSGWVNA